MVLAVEVADTLAETFGDCTSHIHRAGQAEEGYMGHAPVQRCRASAEGVVGSACLCLAALKVAAEVEYTSRPQRHVSHPAVTKGSLLLPLASQVCPAGMDPAPTACLGRRRCARGVGERRSTVQSLLEAAGRSPEPRSTAARSNCGL